MPDSLPLGLLSLCLFSYIELDCGRHRVGVSLKTEWHFLIGLCEPLLNLRPVPARDDLLGLGPCRSEGDKVQKLRATCLVFVEGVNYQIRSQ